MINVLFVGNYSKYNIELLNQMAISNKNFRLCGIANSVDNMIDLINSVPIDVIIMNLKIEKYNEIVKGSILNISKYRETIILLTNYKNRLNSIGKNKYLYESIIKIKDVKEMAHIINTSILNKMRIKIINNKEDKYLRDKIKVELEKIGYNFEHFGTKYLEETICILYLLDDYYDENLERDIYPLVAKKYGKTAHNIKCNIRNATDIMYYDNPEEKIMKYLNYTVPYKPSSKKVILVILNKLRVYDNKSIK